MFKKSMFLTCCLTAIHLTASQNEFSDEISQNANRYQIKIFNEENSWDTQIYVFDQQTGTIWCTRHYVFRKDVYFDPWIQLPPLPIR